MSEIKYTPGPWAWRRFGDTYTLHADHGRRDTIIGAIPHGQMKYPVVAMSIDGRLTDVDPEHPNAKLIVSAPHLLNALQKLVGIEAWIQDREMKELFQNTVYPAIKRATE